MTTGSSRIGVVGSANMDLVVRVDAPPRPGETVFGESFRTVPGGKGLNQAVAARRAGGDVEFLGCLGEDAFGDELASLLDDEHIAHSGCRRVEGASGTAHITVDERGQNAIIVVPGANGLLTADVVTDEVVSGWGWLVTQLEVPLAVVRGALTVARRLGARTVLTPAPVVPLEPDLLRQVDLLVPNEGEALALTGARDPVQAAIELSALCSDVVVTLGEEGCVWTRARAVEARIPAQVVTVVDTTAAGDTFVGALVARLSKGADMRAALDAATIAAGIAVGRAGATASMPTWAEIAG